MANRSGRITQVAEFEGNSRNVSANIPRVNISEITGVTGREGGTAALLAEVGAGVVSRQQDRLDIQAQVEATEAGRRAGASGVPQLQDEATIRGAAFNQSARDAVKTDFELRSRLRISELENEHTADPVGFANQSKAFIEGHVAALREGGYLDIAQTVEANFALQAQNAAQRIDDRQKAIIRDQQLEGALNLQVTLQNDLLGTTGELFRADPKDVGAVLAEISSISAQLSDVSRQIGPDGKPLFSARERVALTQNASDMLGESIGLAYMNSQPDLLAGYREFTSGTASIAIEGEDGQVARIALDDLLDPAVKEKVRKSFFENVRSEISLQNQINVANDRAFQKRSDQLFADLTLLKQDGKLTSSIVEAAKASLSPDQYVAVRAMEKEGGASVSDGSVLAAVTVADAQGQDIRDVLVAQFANGKLETLDFLNKYQQNTERLREGLRDPISVGRDYLSKSLGALSAELGVGQSVAIGGADAEYSLQIERFVEAEGRQPTSIEARDIAENVRSRFSLLAGEDALIALPLPKSITQIERSSRSFTSQNLKDRIIQVSERFLEKHGGSKELRNADPEYIREMRLLKQHFDLMKLREGANGQ